MDVVHDEINRMIHPGSSDYDWNQQERKSRYHVKMRRVYEIIVDVYYTFMCVCAREWVLLCACARMCGCTGAVI
jgi:hypothetical protein